MKNIRLDKILNLCLIKNFTLLVKKRRAEALKVVQSYYYIIMSVLDILQQRNRSLEMAPPSKSLSRTSVDSDTINVD